MHKKGILLNTASSVLRLSILITHYLCIFLTLYNTTLTETLDTSSNTKPYLRVIWALIAALLAI